MLTAHQIQTISDIVDGVEKEDEIEQLALSERKRRRAESVADAAHTVLNILRDNMSDADRAAYESLYAALSAAAQETGASRHLEAARAMWRWTVVGPHTLILSSSLTLGAPEPVQPLVHPTRQLLAENTTAGPCATTASVAYLPVLVHEHIPFMAPLGAMACEIRSSVELDACAVVVPCEYALCPGPLPLRCSAVT